MSLLLRRGDEENAIGDISAARLLYERAAESGSALAARQMGRSYDPAFLPPAVASTLGDLGRAKQWYQRAASLGNAEAATRLKALNQGR
jgi:TPR repeat protein